MEPQIDSQPVTEKQKSVFHQVTPLSKYLAMALFILLPFVGGWIGFRLASEKVVEVEPMTTNDQVVQNTIDAVVESGEPTKSDRIAETEVREENEDFVQVAPSRYAIPANYFLAQGRPFNNLYSYQARKITDSLSLVQVATPDQPAGPVGVVLFDESANRVVRAVTFTLNTMDVWVNSHTRIVLEWDMDSQNRMVVYDYLADKSDVLYVEDEAGVQLAEVCEMGCRGVLNFTSDGRVVFGRYRTQPASTTAEFIETVSVPLPSEYLN